MTNSNSPQRQFAQALDFSGKTVLVVGGSSGIGNGIAQAFRQLGAEVHAWGTRARASDYRLDEGSDLSGLHYAQIDVSDPAVVNAVSLAPRIALEQEGFMDALREIRIAEAIPTADLCLVQRTAVPLPPITGEFAKMLISYSRMLRKGGGAG